MTGPATDAKPPPVFLTASWRNLVVLNYEVPARILAPFVPPGTELHPWEGETLASVVAFEFDDVRVLGIPFPLHTRFEEINLRFYVRRRAADGWRRGVVFVREIVPLPTVAFLARQLYGEPYVALPTRRRFRHHPAPSGSSGSTNEGGSTTGGDATTNRDTTTARYSWHHDGNWSFAEATADTAREPTHPAPDGEQRFITDHKYGYGTRHGRTIEYIVDHPLWRCWKTLDARLDCHPATLRALYGEAFAPYLESPRSAYLVEGSPVTVRRPRAVSS